MIERVTDFRDSMDISANIVALSALIVVLFAAHLNAAPSAARRLKQKMREMTHLLASTMNRTAYNREYWHASARSDARKCRRWAARLVRAVLAELSRAEPWRVVDSERIQPVRRPILRLTR